MPLEKPSLLVHPISSRLNEGQELLLICAVTGTPPVTYKFYHNNIKLQTNTSNLNSMHYHIERLKKGDSGSYYCEALNQANGAHSQAITIDGENHKYLCLEDIPEMLFSCCSTSVFY